MSALDDWFPGSSIPDRRREVVQRRSGKPRPLRKPPHRIRAFIALLAGAALVAPVVAVMAAPAVGGVGIGAREAVTWWQRLPSEAPLSAPLPQRSTIYAADGRTVIATYYAENRVPVALEQIPQHLVDAVLSIEDERFYEHGPIDVRGLARAVVNNLRGGSRQGGSGITQQYVKNLLLTEATTDEQRRQVTATSVDRKLREARLAVEVEKQLGKDGVLAAYLNTVYFGRGAYGVAAAAERFFGVKLSKVTVAQAATLAGILKSPTYYNPVDNPKRSRERRDLVLDRMADNGVITEAQAARAKSSKLVVRLTQPDNGCDQSRWPFYCQLVLDTMASDPGFGATEEARADLIRRGGLRIVTAMDPTAMDQAQRAVDAALEPTNRVATAIAVVQPGTGRVLAIATNRDWGIRAKKGQTQIILPAVPRFQIGSTFKPITLATALEQGFSPYTRLDTPNGYEPAALNFPDGGFNNDDDRGHGMLNAFQATAESVNTFYVQLIERTGVLRVADMAGRLGMTSLPRSGPRAVGKRDAALTLGAFESSPVDVATVYATLAARGVGCRAMVITSVTRQDGTPVPSPSADCRQVVPAAVADTVTSVLQGVFGPGGTGGGLEIPDRPAAGKTGTTNNSGATWFAGYTPQLAAAVWVGDPRGPAFALRDVEAYGDFYDVVYGRTIAGRVWQQAMTDLSEGLPVVPFPTASPAAALGVAPSLPDVRGLQRDAAIAALVRAGYRVRVSGATAGPDPVLPPGLVAAQTPKAGTPLGLDGLVTLTLTAGSETSVQVPGQPPA